MNHRFEYGARPFAPYRPRLYQPPSAEFLREEELFSAYEDFEGGAPAGGAPGGLAPAVLNNAILGNRFQARQIGWGCVVGGTVTPIVQLRTLLGLAVGAAEADIANAVANYQRTNGRLVDGQLGPRTWATMLRTGLPGHPVVPTPGFRRASWPVYFGGRKLGVLEKTAPYLSVNDGTSGGASIQVAFRVTDMAAVTSAGFADEAGEDQFRWVQVISTNRPNQDGVNILIRRFRQYIDPGAGTRDVHPYYWDEPGQGDAAFRVDAFVNRSPFDAVHPASSQLCYDLIFEDVPRRSLSLADPARRVFWNSEVALVGVRAWNRNVILNTVSWGFDIVLNAGVPGVKLNPLIAGPRGGSTVFREVLRRAITAGTFPGHCFLGLPGAAGCR